jgi:hydroxyacylglutathione hydrolase
MNLTKGNLVLQSFPVGSYQCNCSILYSSKTLEAIIIDPGNDHLHILKKINELGIKVKSLLHTHAHFDHIGRSSEIKAQTNAKIHLHQGDQFLYDILPKQGLFF